MGVLEKAALDVPGRMLTPKSSAFAPPLVFKALSLLPSLRALNGGGPRGGMGRGGCLEPSLGSTEGPGGGGWGQRWCHSAFTAGNPEQPVGKWKSSV